MSVLELNLPRAPGNGAFSGDSFLHNSRPRRAMTADLVVQFAPQRVAAPREEFSRPAGFRDLLFPCLWTFISLVSAFDVYLTVRFQEHLGYQEENPVGRWLLELHGWEPSLLIGAKFFGSTLVLGFLTLAYLRDRRMGLVFTTALAIFQFGLLGYLLLV
ncbi:MAG: hypothetical protein ACT4QC_21905 [Planctomycetaceae bacterium]